MKRFWQISNIVSVIFALILNFLVGAQILNLPGINEISDKYSTALTPASYAFAIWSLIYILLIVFAIYQARDLAHPSSGNDIPAKIGPWFIVANICNGIWTYVFVKEWVSLSVIILLLLTTSLYTVIYKLRIALDDQPFSTIAFVWWPLLIYTGWVTIATVVNIASWTKYLNIQISSIVSIMVLIFIAGILLTLLIKRSVRELVLASTWGIIAIGFEQFNLNRNVSISAFIISLIMLVAVVSHAYHYRKSFPGFKLIKNKEG